MYETPETLKPSVRTSDAYERGLLGPIGAGAPHRPHDMQLQLCFAGLLGLEDLMEPG